MQDTTNLAQMLPYLVPFIVLEIALVVFALADLRKRQQVAGGNKWIWVLVIVALQVIGPAIYLFAGRREARVESD